MPQPHFQPNKKFVRSFRLAKYMRWFEIGCVLGCASLLLIAVSTFTAEQLGLHNVVLEILFRFVDGRVFSVLSIVSTIAYCVLLAFNLILFEHLKDVYEDEFERLKGSAQAFQAGQISEEIKDMVEDYQSYSQPMFGDSRKSLFINFLASLLFAGFYLLFIFMYLK